MASAQAESRDATCRALPGSGGSVPCQIFPCRAQYQESRNLPWIQEPIVNPGPIMNPGTHLESRNPSGIEEFIVNPEIQLPIICRGRGETGTPPLGQGFRTAWLLKGNQFPWNNLKSGLFILTFWDPSSHICQICVRVARWRNRSFRQKTIWLLDQSLSFILQT